MPRSSTAALGRLPQVPDTWLIASAQLRIWITPPGAKPYRPFVIFVLSMGDGSMWGTEIVESTPTPIQVWKVLTRAMREPPRELGKPCRPQGLAVTSSEMAKGLGSFLADAGMEIDLYEIPTPDEVADIVRDLEAHMRGGKPEIPGLLAAQGVTPELVGSFFAAAADFYRAAPWVQLSNFQVVALRHPAERDHRYTIVMGQAGVEYGLATYLRWQDVERIFFHDDNPFEVLPAVGAHSLFYDTFDREPFDDLDAIEKYGWEVAAEGAYPIAVVMKKDGAARPTRADLLWYEAALRALPLLVREHLKPDPAKRGDYLPVETTLQVPTHAGLIDVAVKYPAGQLALENLPAQELDWAQFDQDKAPAADEPPAFDRRAMEGTMFHLAQQMGAETGSRDSKLDKAQQLMYEAWEQTNPAKRIALAHDALVLSPDCADAYVLLAEEEADTASRALEYYQKGMEAGARALGDKYFKEHAGHFWGMLETRPYMRAREGLAHMLWRVGRKDEALAHYRELLRLNPGDNQGVRYLLVDLLLQLERQDELDSLLKQYHDDWSAAFTYTRALHEFRKHGVSARANTALHDALSQNRFVPAYLTGQKRIPNARPEYMGMGDEREAIYYASEHINHWRRTTGAVEWLTTQLQAKPTRAEPKPHAARRKKRQGRKR